MLKLSISRIDELFSAISNERTLYLPIESDGLVQFGQWSDGVSAQLDKLLTTKSPKDFFFPHTEDIAAFKMQGKELTIKDKRSPIEPFVVFGVRACDARSLELLDRVFLSEPVDTFYQARRENGIVITSACFKPEESCFCTAFKAASINPLLANFRENILPGEEAHECSTEARYEHLCADEAVAEYSPESRQNGVNRDRLYIDALNPGGDIAVWIFGEVLYWQAYTKRGKALTQKLEELFEHADETAVEQEKEKAKEIFAKLPFGNLNLESFTPEVLLEKFNSPEWEKLNPACISCGTCTFICPTCHCYDIQDHNTGDEVVRFRCWDSCMYSDFTLMAHGNPRTSKLERFRQRYMHKLIYFPDKNDGIYACVGCGRCVQKCPVSMNIVKVAKALGVDKDV